MANKAVSLYISSKVGGKWTFRKPPKRLQNLTGGSFVLFWYQGVEDKGRPKKRSQNVGTMADAARIAVARKESDLRILAAGGTVRDSETESAVEKFSSGSNASGLVVRDAVQQYLDDCRGRQGRDGYGMAPRTLAAYEGRLGFLLQFDGVTPVAEVDSAYLKRFRRFLREHPSKLSDRYCHNIMQAVNTLMLRHGIQAGKPILREMSFAPKECKRYTDHELTKFFAACTPDEKLVFQFFLHSMCREQEVSHAEVGDLDFGRNVLTISSKPHRGFRLKGKHTLTAAQNQTGHG